MSFAKAASALTTRHSWSSIYRSLPANHKEDFTTSPLLFFHSWQKMTKQADIILFLLEFPDIGVIFCDGRKQPTLIHGIQKQETSTFLQGFIGNRINSSPVEFEISNEMFGTKKTAPPITVDSDTDDDPCTPHQVPNKNNTDNDINDNTTKAPSGTTSRSFILIHPFILPYLLDLPQPLSSQDTQLLFRNLEQDFRQLHWDNPTTLQDVNIALTNISNWIDQCSQNTFQTTPPSHYLLIRLRVPADRLSVPNSISS
jgi:hypothetical protein